MFWFGPQRLKSGILFILYFVKLIELRRNSYRSQIWWIFESFYLILSTRGINLFFLSKNLFYFHVGIPLRPMNFRDIIISISQKEIILTLSLRDKNQSPRSRGNLGKKKWKLPCQTFLSLERSPAEFPKFKLFTRVILVLWNLDNNYLRRLCAPGYIKI